MSSSGAIRSLTAKYKEQFESHSSEKRKTLSEKSRLSCQLVNELELPIREFVNRLMRQWANLLIVRFTEAKFESIVNELPLKRRTFLPVASLNLHDQFS